MITSGLGGQEGTNAPLPLHPQQYCKHSTEEVVKRLTGLSRLIGELQANEESCLIVVDSILEEGTRGYLQVSMCNFTEKQ